MPLETSPEDYFPFLLELKKAHLPCFLVGGQAVNFCD